MCAAFRVHAAAADAGLRQGIARALNVFRGTQPSPVFRVVVPEGAALQRLVRPARHLSRRLLSRAAHPRQVVRPETLLVRPFVVCAVLRGVTFDAARYASFIDLQAWLLRTRARPPAPALTQPHAPSLPGQAAPEHLPQAVAGRAAAGAPQKRTHKLLIDPPHPLRQSPSARTTLTRCRVRSATRRFRRTTSGSCL